MNNDIVKLRKLIADAVETLQRRNDGEWRVPLQAELEHELSEIERYGWTDYFALVAEIARLARNAGGYIAARGAAGASVLAYVLGIAHVNPVGIPNLLFERFLNCDTKHTSTLVLMDMDRVGYDATMSHLKKRHGNVIIDKGRRHLEPDCCMLGGHRIGITHLPALDVIADTEKLSLETRRIIPSYAKAIQDVAAVMEIFQNGLTDDIFEFNSQETQKMLRSFCPQNFKQLAAFHAANNSGMKRSMGMLFASRIGEVDTAAYRHPLGKECLAETNGAIIYEEQIICLLRIFAGFTFIEAERCRKALAKRKSTQFEFKTRFIDGCLRNLEFVTAAEKQGHDTRLMALQIWQDIYNASCEASLKAHSLCWTHMAIRMASLKMSCPEEWAFAIENRKSTRHRGRNVREFE